MDFNVKHLRYFVAVADCGSVTKAADRLNISQPSLSLCIRSLEQFLGFSLFDRSPSKIGLSRAGREFLPDARLLVAESERFNRYAEQLRRGDNGSLRIGATSYSFEHRLGRKLLDAFMEQHPLVQVSIVSGHGPSVIAALRGGEMDVGTVWGAVPPEGFEGLELYRLELSLLLPEELPLAAYDEVPLEALNGVQVATWARDFNPPFFDLSMSLIEGAGANLIAPPDPDLVPLARYAQERRIVVPTFEELLPKMTFTSLALRPIAGRPNVGSIFLIRASGDDRPVVNEFWQIARDEFPAHRK